MKRKKNSTNDNTLLYSEYVSIGKFAKITIYSVILFFIVITIIMSVLFLQEMLFFLFLMGGLCIFILFMYSNYRGLEITLTETQIEVSYRMFNRKTIPINSIISCEPIKATFRRYGGTGIRLGLDGSWAYTTDFGGAVKLISQNRRPFVFSTKNPQKICDLIKKLAK